MYPKIRRGRRWGEVEKPMKEVPVQAALSILTGMIIEIHAEVMALYHALPDTMFAGSDMEFFRVAAYERFFASLEAAGYKEMADKLRKESKEEK